MTSPAPAALVRTPQQRIAADPALSSWVSANAGTGKTGVLIDRIARLLLADVAPERILCLTFTKAAAAEMANRLSGVLGAWAAAGEDALDDALAALLQRPPEPDERARARHLFARVLEAPEGLRIRTIHSFCESLLGRFPLEAGVHPDFRVVDERTALELRTEARDRVLAAAHGVRGTDLAEAMDRLAGLVDEDRFDRLLRELDDDRDRFDALLERSGGSAQLARNAARTLGIESDSTANNVLMAAVADDGLPDLNRLAAAWALGAATNKDGARALGVWLSDPAERRAAGYLETYAPLFVTGEGKARAISRLVSNGAREADESAVDIALTAQADVVTTLARLRAIEVVAATDALVRVGAAMLAAYDELKHNHAVLDYEDLIAHAGALLADAGGVSWVHYKLDGGIAHVLVDEAQDTSPAQWSVIKALCGEFFAGAGRHEETEDAPRTVFAVGDEKQSIYSFQGADPRQLAATGEHFAGRVQDAGLAWRPVEMEKSFRAVPAVLRVVDRVFAGEAADGLSFAGRPILHHWERDGEAGMVELWPTLKPEPAAEQDPYAPLDAPPPASPAVRLAERIAETIDGWLQQGEVRGSTGRRIRPGDIMVLVRTRGAFADAMVRALKTRGIDVAGRDRMVLTDHLAVMDLVALGRLALLPEDDLNTATVLKGPFAELDEDQLFRLCHGRKGHVWDELVRQRDAAPAFAAAHDRLAAIRRRADYEPPFEFYARLLGPEGGRRDLLAHLGEEAVEPVEEFLALALEFEREHVPSLEGFLHWLQTGAVEVKRDLELERDEVRVLTVHGAKGLEAPVVFLPDTCSLPAAQHDPDLLWTDDDQAMLWPVVRANEDETCHSLREAGRRDIEREYRRLLYVAMTRAEDRLYVAGFEGARERPDGCWHALVEAALAGMDDVEELADGALRFQEPQTAPVAELAPELPLPTGTVGAPDWALAPPAAEVDPPWPLAPSRPSEEEPAAASPLGPDQSVRFRRGRLIHRLLQSLPDLEAAQRTQAAESYLVQAAPDLDDAARQAIAGECVGLLGDSRFAELFGPGSRAEVPLVGTLMGAEGAQVVSGQVDRLLVTPDRVVVADFKTNRPPPADAADVSAGYLRQMAAYRALLGDIYPHHQVDAVLVWTWGPRLMPLDHEILARHAP